MPNRLARESSPYLLQHANNPVDWFAWGEEAFERARAGDKPIFLSVGYSTCHWCHVMEHESFESPEVAAVLNAGFVPIKVDREERPDVDRVYMTFVQATTGAGGWPMSVWLTPELKPFYGGTYFPPSGRWGRPGFVEVLNEVARLWRNDRPRLLESATSITERLRRATTAPPAAGATLVAPPDSVRAGGSLYLQAFDRRNGGFGSAPKFPRPSELLFLLRAWAQSGDDPVGAIVVETLRGMALGGMYDHVGGGFHRYSVDAEWRVPHFEKMLYDQAQLVIALVEVAQATGDPFWRGIAAETIAYVERDLRHPDGGFYSAEDADSVAPELADADGAHKTEGAFYLWSDDEIDELMGPDADVVKTWFGVEPGGNAPDDPQGEFGTKNILYVAPGAQERAASALGRSGKLGAVIDRAKRTLFVERNKRPRPHLDDKVLTAWNGLMIAACARSARVLDGETTGDGRDARVTYTALAENAATFLRATVWDASRGVLLRRAGTGTAAIDGFAEDYACLTWGLLELFQTTGGLEWLEWAFRLQQSLDDLFWDEAGGGWFSTTGRDPSILLRMKEDYDGAEPSASSVAVMNLIVLTHLTGRADWASKVERTLGRLGTRAGDLARQAPLMLANLATWHAGLRQIVIVADPSREDTVALRRAASRPYLPFAVHVPIEPGAQQDALSRHLPWVAALAPRDGRATAYVCRSFACDLPVTSPEELEALLRRR